MKSFVVEFWSRIFNILGKISPFWLIRKLIPTTEGSYRFVECWVLGNLLLSFITLLFCSTFNLHLLETIVVVWGILRVIEVFIYQINVLLFDEYRARKARKSYAIRGFRRIVILLLHNYIEIVFWFALFYHHWNWAFQNGRIALDSFIESVNFSFVTMTTFGHSTVAPNGTLGDVLIFIQAVIGVFMALLIIARFIALIPTPKTLDEFEK